MEYEKLKVSELRRLLKEKGLSMTGSKLVLVSRLQAAAENGAEEEPLQEPSDNEEDVVVERLGPVGEDDDILNEDVEDIAEAEEVEEVEEAEETEESKPEEVKEEETEAPKKVVLTKISFSESGDEEDKAATKVSAEELLSKRAQRFGVKSEDAKKEARAARFGITESTAKTTTAVSGDKPGSTTKEPSTEELEKLKKRAERFGAVVSTKLTKEVNQDQLQKRKARFGNLTNTGTTSVSSPEVEEKKKRRLERFGMNK